MDTLTKFLHSDVVRVVAKTAAVFLVGYAGGTLYHDMEKQVFACNQMAPVLQYHMLEDVVTSSEDRPAKFYVYRAEGSFTVYVHCLSHEAMKTIDLSGTPVTKDASGMLSWIRNSPLEELPTRETPTIAILRYQRLATLGLVEIPVAVYIVKELHPGHAQLSRDSLAAYCAAQEDRS